MRRALKTGQVLNTNSNSNSKRYLRWTRHRLLDVFNYTTPSPIPRRLDIIFNLKLELDQFTDKAVKVIAECE
jgi:hypothetical protein